MGAVFIGNIAAEHEDAQAPALRLYRCQLIHEEIEEAPSLLIDGEPPGQFLQCHSRDHGHAAASAGTVVFFFNEAVAGFT